MPALIAIVAAGGQAFVDRLRTAWEAGDAVLPVDPRLPAPARRRLLEAMRPDRLVDASGDSTSLPAGAPVAPGDALVVATSGTTGEPKGAVLTHAALAASAASSHERLGVDHRGDRWLACLPLAHIGGLAVVTRAVLTETALTVLEGFDVEEVAAAARRGANLVALVPTMLARLVAAGVDGTTFRTILLGGSTPPANPPENAVISYGMTETGSGVVYDGIPLDGVHVDIVGGEVRLRGPMLLRCYRDGRDPFDAEGRFPTGDAGHWDAAGRLVIEGRIAHVIVTGGEKVWPTAVEAALLRHPAVAEAAVIGRADVEWGQRVVAYVAVAAGHGPPSLEDVREAVKVQLPAYAAPRELHVVDSLPRTALGKVRHSALTDDLGR